MRNRNLGDAKMANGKIVNMKAFDENGVPIDLRVNRPKWTHPYGTEWTQMSQGALEKITKDTDMTLTAYRVLFLLVTRLGWNNETAIHQAEMAKELGIHPQQVSKAIKLLLAKNWVYQGKPLGQIKTYILNEELSFRGKPDQHRKIREWRRESMKAKIVALKNSSADRDE
jgi:hypothetical protein